MHLTIRSPLHLFRRSVAATTTSLPPPLKPSFLKELDPNHADPSDSDEGPRNHLVTTLCRKHRFEEAVALLFGQRSRVSDAVSVLDVLPRPPSPAVYDPLFRLCLRLSAAEEASRVYHHARVSGFEAGTIISNRLMYLFAKSGRLADARKLFDEMASRDPCSWNTLISAYSRSGELVEARELFDRMPAKTRDSFSWSSLMSGYVRQGRPMEALGLYREMQLAGGSRSSRFMVSSALAASTAIPCLRYGKEIHAHVIRVRLASDVVLWSALSEMYAKCRRIDEARHIFDRTSGRDVVLWTAMLGWYFDCGRVDEGFLLFSDMLRAGFLPNEFTYAGVLNACSCQAMEELGRQVHGRVVRTGLASHLFPASSLVHMYSKCGDVESAENAFKQMSMHDLVSWTSMISCHAQNGQPEMALEYFEQMLQSGVKPDQVTFVGVLSACAHGGLVDEGLEIFRSIGKEYGLKHTPDHYACVVDLLSRAGRFEEVKDVIGEMPFKPDKFLWASLLNGCRIRGNATLARQAAEALFEIEPGNPATYVTLANIYAKVGRWDDVAWTREMMGNKGVKKKPGYSWIEVKRQVHRFMVGDDSHPRTKEIYLQLEKLGNRMMEEGYVPDTDFVLHDVEEEQKEQNLVYHSERLAVAFGIIATQPGMPIKVYKNLRTCGDCHTAIKFISRISQREIIVRDSSRFHHFKDGSCTCRDYW